MAPGDRFFQKSGPTPPGVIFEKVFKNPKKAELLLKI